MHHQFAIRPSTYAALVMLMFSGEGFAGAVLAFADPPPGPSGGENARRVPDAAAEAYRIGPGPHLLLDDYLIARSAGVERKVNPPRRFLDKPVVTGAPEHQNWQPFLTVLHDPEAAAQKRFRMWYNVDAVDDPADGEFFGVSGHLASPDGIRWPGPYTRLNSLAVDGRVRFGASVVDEGPRHSPAAERYKMMYFDAGKHAGPRVAFSPDGLAWTLQNGGKPVIDVANGDDIWTAAYDPLRKRYFLIGKIYEPYHLDQRGRGTGDGDHSPLLHQSQPGLQNLGTNQNGLFARREGFRHYPVVWRRGVPGARRFDCWVPAGVARRHDARGSAARGDRSQ